MKSKKNHPTPEEDEMWSKLLSPLRIEPTPEADFEGRFIEEFHRRLQEEAARESFMSKLLYRVRCYMGGFTERRWATAVTTVLLVAFVAGALMWPQADVPKAVASVGSPVEQVTGQQKRVVVDIAPSVLVDRDDVMASKVIVPIHEVEKTADFPAETTPDPAAE